MRLRLWKEEKCEELSRRFKKIILFAVDSKICRGKNQRRAKRWLKLCAMVASDRTHEKVDGGRNGHRNGGAWKLKTLPRIPLMTLEALSIHFITTFTHKGG